MQLLKYTKQKSNYFKVHFLNCLNTFFFKNGLLSDYTELLFSKDQANTIELTRQIYLTFLTLNPSSKHRKRVCRTVGIPLRVPEARFLH